MTMRVHLPCIPGREEAGRMVDVVGQLRRVQLTRYPGESIVHREEPWRAARSLFQSTEIRHTSLFFCISL